MKKIYVPLLAAALLFFTSCVENSQKYRSLLSERDSLADSLKNIEKNYNEALDILNYVETNFDEIRTAEDEVAVNMKNIENQPESKKQELAAEVDRIRRNIESGREKIKDLQNRLNRSSASNSALKKTVDRLERELEAKAASLSVMESELEKKNIVIEEMEHSIDSLHSDIEKLGNEKNLQAAQIDAMDRSEHTVWYCAMSRKDLKESGIISKKSAFSKNNVLSGEFDKSRFSVADLRDFRSLELDSKSVRLLSQHPEGSYTVEKSEGKTYFSIVDPEKFWSISRYLVIEL